jgi:hypothetical protein
MQTNFEIRNAEAEALLQDIGSLLKKATDGTGFGFTLMIFSFNGPEMFYCSNAERESMIQAMQEFQAKFREN